MQLTSSQYARLILVLLSLFAVVGLDFYLPLTVAGGVTYVLPVLLVFLFFADKKRITFAVTSATLTLVILKYLWNIYQGAFFWTATLNRAFTVFAITSVFTTLTMLFGQAEVLQLQILNRFSLKKKFLAILLTVLSIFIFTFAISNNFYRATEDEMTSLDETLLKPMNSIILVRQNIGFGCGIHLFKNYIMRGDEHYYTQSKICFQKALKAIEESEFDQKFAKSLNDIRASIDIYLEMLEKAKAYRSSGKTNIAELDQLVKVDDKKSVAGMVYIEQTLNQSLQAQKTLLNASAKRRGALIFVTFFIGFLFVFVVVLSLSRHIDREISGLADAAGRLSDGHLEDSITRSSEDELGDLAESLNTMRVHLKSNLESLANSNKDLEQFAYVASHDLQEPLRKIMAFGSRLEVSTGPQLDTKSKEYLDKIMQSSSRMRRLIDDLLSYSRVSTQNTGIEKVNLNRIFAEILEDLEMRIKESQAQFHVDKFPAILANAPQMRQLFQNLVGNALKFRKLNQAPKIDILCKRLTNDKIRITVKDNGIGFDKKYADKIIVPFQRLHSRDEYPGTGIGLAICHRIVTKHGSSLLIDSVEGVGSEFSFDFKCEA